MKYLFFFLALGYTIYYCLELFISSIEIIVDAIKGDYGMRRNVVYYPAIFIALLWTFYYLCL